MQHHHQQHQQHNIIGAGTNITGNNGSPVPPYMPIQGTRRNGSAADGSISASDGKKKHKQKDKCTHQ